MPKPIVRKFSQLCKAAALVLAFCSCAAREPIRIGFAGSVTGPHAALGVDGRDGALLAVALLNDAGGINGRPLELLVGDDQGTNEGAIAADKELMDAGVFLIIGHMTSQEMTAAWDVYQDSGVIFLSPTVATPQLAELDDNFFRLIVLNSLVAEQLARYAREALGLQKAAVFYDMDNASFTDPYQAQFSTRFEEAGGRVVFRREFSSQAAPDFKPDLLQAKQRGADALFIAASAFDTALFAQQARLAGLEAQILATNWALTEDLIENGGQAVEGLLAVVSHDENNSSTEYREFQTRFIERYHRKPTFAAGYGYEAVMVAAEALKKTDGSREGLKEALLRTQDFPGVHGKISFDRYGDVNRALYLLRVVHGKFETVQPLGGG